MYEIQASFTEMDDNNTIFKLKKGSEIAKLLIPHGITNNESTIKQVMQKIKQIIITEKLYDNLNESIILCSKSLEHALNYSTLHVSELRKLIIEQMEHIPNRILDNILLRQLDEQINIKNLNKDSIRKNKNKRFHVKPLFLELLRKVETPYHLTQTIFSYKETIALFHIYILDKKDTIIDKKNPKIATVKNYPLGIALGVNTFHICQVNELLWPQMVPFKSHRKRHMSDDSNDNNADDEQTTNSNNKRKLDKQKMNLMKKRSIYENKNKSKVFETNSKISTNLCMVCLINPKNSTFIHTKLGHTMCCYNCAKKYWKENPNCPVCNRKIERVIKIILS